jgi:hypothetical protein
MTRVPSVNAHSHASARPASRRTIIAFLRIPVLCAGLPALLLVGCGSSDNGITSKPAGQILAATRAAAQSASSVHVTARSTVHGAKLTLNAHLAKDRGYAHLSFASIGVTAVRVGDTLYIKGNPTFDARLEMNRGVRVPTGTWLKGPASGPLGQIGAFIDMEKEVPLILSGSGKITKGKTAKLSGQPAIILKQEHKLYAGVLYVAATGQPYPLKLTKTGQETGQITFTGWNDPVTVTPPTNAVEISQLQPLKKGH